MDNPQLTKQIFCANEQQVTPHTGAVDGNGEFVFTCECGRAIKFSGNTTPEQFAELLIKHEEANKGQMGVAAQEKKLAELLGGESIQDAEIVSEEAETQPETPEQPNEPIEEQAVF